MRGEGILPFFAPRGNKKRPDPSRNRSVSGKVFLRLFDQARLDCLYANPRALDCARRRADSDTLNIRLKGALGLFYKLQTDTAAFLALTFMNDFTTAYGTLTCH